MVEVLTTIKDLLLIFGPIGTAVGAVLVLKTRVDNLKEWMSSISASSKKTTEELQKLQVQVGQLEVQLKTVEEDIRELRRDK